MSFASTHLMIKRHRVTGLMYFCKTTAQDPFKYQGSGRYWKNHLKKHGRHVDTIWSQLFTDKNDIVEFALFFSDFHDIVKHRDPNGKKTWANEVPEDGLQGGQNRGMSGPGITNYGNTHTEEAKKTMALFGDSNGMYGKNHTLDSIEMMKKNRPSQTGSKNPVARPCHTPNGWFDTVREATKNESISEPTLRTRLQSTDEKYKEYYYKGNENETI